MTDLSTMTKDQLVKLIEASQDKRPFHVHSDGTVCRSPYCNSLFDPPELLPNA